MVPTWYINETGYLLFIGQEFDVLILSTVESVHIDGRPFDPLKSFAHPAVFNTAITRARSLIVAVGNPFTLRNCERAIQGSSRCWDLFISTCEKNATFFSKQPAAAGSNVVRNDPRTRDGMCNCTCTIYNNMGNLNSIIIFKQQNYKN